MSRNFELMQQMGVSSDTENRQAPVDFNLTSAADAKVDRRALVEPEQLAQEETLRLVQRIFLNPEGLAAKVVMFAGVDAGSGCSGVCAAAARILASNTHNTVCLLEANLRKPTLPQLFGVSNHFGLSDALQGDGRIREYVKPVGPNNLWLLSCGAETEQTPKLLNSTRMKERIAELRREFDYILVDVPALAEYADATALAGLMDGVVVVLEANATRREAASQAVDRLRAAQAKVLGAVLNKRTFPIPEPLYRRL